MPPVRLFIADALELVAEGLRSWLRDQPDLVIVGHATTGQALLDALPNNPVDVVLLEVSLPVLDGIDTMKRLRASFPEVKVLAHSTLKEIEYVNSMRIEGAAGYLVKGGSRDELIVALRTVLEGGEYLSEAARRSVEQGYAFTEKRMDGEYIGLTVREREIIRLVALERTNGEIAEALFISEDTVKTHRKNLMTKLNVRSTAGLVKYALDRRWV
ncbi:MAG: response regulator transcription factor [Flavobacteriales bacterium]|nr:response regulator transcription factor [Flavobacteriales bacterium]